MSSNTTSETSPPETLSPIETTSAENTSPSNEPTSSETTTEPADQILSSWQFKLQVYRYVNILQGTMKRDSSEIVLAEASLAKTPSGQYKILISPHAVKVDDEDLPASMIRQERLEYPAELDGDRLTFALESELFAHKDHYEDGLVKPLQCNLTIDQEGTTRTAGERQIHQNIQRENESTREYNLQIYIDLEEIN